MDSEQEHLKSSVVEDVKNEREIMEFGCVHYKRKAKFVSPCCGKIYSCRFCHDENEQTHTLDRKQLSELICEKCGEKQRVQKLCEKCGTQFGKYSCLICNLFDDDDKSQYHCNDCGICRVGGKEKFFHCLICDMCLPIQIKDSHKCVEKVSRGNCAVCLENIHDSRIPCHIPPTCGHLLHLTCFEELLSKGFYACPICQQSMLDMKEFWASIDIEVENTPMPEEYENMFVDILCRDCHETSYIKFHVAGLKCQSCGGYNTTRIQKHHSEAGEPEPEPEEN